MTETIATSSFEKTDVSAAISNFSVSPVSTQHNIQFTQVRSSNQEPIKKEKLNGAQESSASSIQVEILTKTKEESEVRRLIAESWGEVAPPAPSSLDSDEMMRAKSIDNSAALNVAEEFLGDLNTEAELQKLTRSEGIPQPLCIPGLDESAHEILWKYQAPLEKLNADLHAERIKSAIADHPQHLESAILALIENSAKGAKTSVAATGFLLNALRHGWKPRQSSSSAGAQVQIYKPHPLMLESRHPPTLSELVERKRLMWKTTTILRPSIAAWAEATPGVVLGELGPELEQQVDTPTTEPQSIDEKDLMPRHATKAAYPTNLNQTDPVLASARTAPLAAATPAESPQLDPNSPLEVEPSIDLRGSPPLQEVNSYDPVASERTLLAGTTAHTARVEPPLKQSPKQQLQAKPK